MFGISKKVDAGMAPVEHVGMKTAPFTRLSGRPKEDFVGASVMPDRVTSSHVQKAAAGAELLKQQVALQQQLAKHMESIQDSCVELHENHQKFQAGSMKNAEKIAQTDAKHVKAVAAYNNAVGVIREETKAAISQFDDVYNKQLQGIGF